MISDAITLIDFLKKNWEQYQTISALFNWEGKRLDGDDKIVIQKIIIKDQKDKWFYKVKELEPYVFVYMPLIPTVHLDYGLLEGDTNPDAKIFRFVGNIFSSVISGGNSNIKTDFIIVGYKPKELLGKKESQ